MIRNLAWFVLGLLLAGSPLIAAEAPPERGSGRDCFTMAVEVSQEIK